MKKTKIVCSIGPSTQKWENFKGLVENGMNVARINFSHATIEERHLDEELIARANKELGANIATLYDTKGPDLRTCTFEGDYIDLVLGETIKVVEEDVTGTKEQISFNYKGIVKQLEVGMSVLLDDGFYKLEVVAVSDDKQSADLKILNAGTIKSRRGVCIPGIKLDIPYVSETDREDIKYACEHDGDFLAISFVNCADDIKEVRNLCSEFGKPDMQIVSKVETQYAMNNLDEIVDESDVIMIARGDLGVETGVENLPLYQQMMIDQCRAKGKRVIMATQMMTSMKKSIRPTNAEVTDVANAVLSGCDAVMTSDETTMGEYPVETIANMRSICKRVEGYYKYEMTEDVCSSCITEIIANSAVMASNCLQAKAIVANTITGKSAYKISNLRPDAFVIAAVPNEKVAKSLALNYGVHPMVIEGGFNANVEIDTVISANKEMAKEYVHATEGDVIVITGNLSKQKEYKDSNSMKIEKI